MNKKRLNILLSLTILAFPLTQGLLAPFLNTISRVYGLNYQQTGYIFSFLYTGFMLSALTIGYLSDKFGVRLIIWGMLLNAFAAILIFLSPSYGFFVGAVVILGISLGVVDILAAASLAQINHEKKGFYINIMQVIASLGGIVAPLAAGYMVQQGIYWKYAFLGSGILIFVLFALLFCEPFPKSKEPSDINFMILKSLIRDKYVIVLCLTSLCIYSIEGGLLGWLGVYMTKYFQVSDFLSGFSISMMFIAMAASRLIIAFLSDRVKPANLIFASSLISAGFLAVALLSDHFIVALIFFFLTIFASAGIFTTTVVLANSLFPDYAGTLLSLTFSVGTLGVMVFPSLIGTIAQVASLKTGLFLTVLLFVVIALLFSYMFYSNRNPKNPNGESLTSGR